MIGLNGKREAPLWWPAGGAVFDSADIYFNFFQKGKRGAYRALRDIESLVRVGNVSEGVLMLLSNVTRVMNKSF